MAPTPARLALLVLVTTCLVALASAAAAAEGPTAEEVSTKWGQ